MKRVDIVGALLICVTLIFVPALAVSEIADDDVTDKNEVTKHILEGDNLLLTCKKTQLRDRNYYWIKNGTYGGSSELYARGWKLEFFSISRNASAIYICHAVDVNTGDNVTMATVNVDVQFAAECKGMSIAPRVITENETFILNCSMHGNPQPTWSVMNNDTGVSVVEATHGADVSLNVTVACGYSGTWMCTGYNEFNHGVNASLGYYVTVLCPPRPEPLTPSWWVYDYVSTVGADITMAINVTSDPDPTCSWSRDDGGQIRGRVAPKSAHMTLKDVGVDDFGNYTLRMRNNYGGSVVHFRLKAYGYPQKPHNIRVWNISHSGAHITWISGFDMGTPQRFWISRWTGSKFTPVSSEISGPYKHGGVGVTWTYHLTGLLPSYEYKMAVVAQNYQNSTLSQPFLFHTAAAPVRQTSGVSTPVIVGASVGGGIVVMATLVVLVFFVNRRRRTYMVSDKPKLLPSPSIQTPYGAKGYM